MNMRLSTNRKFKRVFANILSIFVILAMAFPVTGSASAQEPSPGLRAFPDQDRADGMFWPAGELVHLTINGNTFGPQTADDTGYVEFLLGEYDLKRGDTLTLSSEEILVTHTARQLFVDNIDLDAQTVFGTVDGGPQTVHVWIGDAQLYVQADESGNWYADFSSFGGVLSPGVCGNAEAWEGPGSTIIDWCLPPPPSTPWLIAFPENDAVEGWEWPDGATITLTIDNASGLSWSGTAAVTTWGDPRTYVRFDFWEDYDLQVGDMVTLTDEFGTSTTHEVQPLSITEVDMDTDIVSGTAAVGAQLQVWAHQQSGPPVNVTASDGTWQADLTDVYDITYGTGGRAWIVAEGGNATAVDWHVPNPYFQVQLENNNVDGWEWTPNSQVSISINGAEAAVVPTDEWGTFRSHFEEMDPFVPGMDFLITDGVHTKIQTTAYLEITNVDQDADTVSGKANAGQTINVWVHGEGAPTIQVTADDTGQWTADFSGQWNLIPGTDGAAQIDDEDGDGTWVPWRILNTHFTVFPEWEWFDGLDWPNGATVVITVAGKPECETTKESWGYFFNGNFGEGCDVVFGDTVTFTDGTRTQTHVVRNLDITAVDPKKDTIAGIADAGTVVYVWPHDGWFEPLQVTAKRSGAWKLDLGAVGYDVREGASGRSEIRDENGNATAVDWYAPNPRFTVFPEWEFFDGLDWPDGASVKITVKGKPECKVTKQSWGYFFNGNFGEGCDVEIGDLVRFTDGKTSRTHVVRNLAVTAVDPDENTITGTADTGTTVYVWPHDGWFEPLQAVADDAGLWQVDLDDAGYDLQQGASGRSEIRDDVGNATAVDWYVPNPRMTIYPDAQWFDGWDWSDGVTVTISVEGRPECTLTKVPQGGEFAGRFPEACLVAAGDIVYFTDGFTTIQHTVRNLAITKIDQDANTVSGVADTGAYVDVWVWDTDNPHIYVTAQDGQWVADFGAFGMDLDVNMGIQAEIRDENGNGTSVDHGTYTRMVASITENWFYVIDFDPLSTLNYSIYESQGGTLVANGTYMANINGYAWIDFENHGQDLEPGNYLVVTDETNQKELVIEEITFDLFDLTNGQLSGTAAEPYGRRVWVGIGWQDRDTWMMDVNTKPKTGTWLADFGQPVPNDYSWAAAQIFDADGDASEVRPSVIVP